MFHGLAIVKLSVAIVIRFTDVVSLVIPVFGSTHQCRVVASFVSVVFADAYPSGRFSFVSDKRRAEALTSDLDVRDVEDSKEYIVW